MPRSLIFDEDGVPSEIKSGELDVSDVSNFIWTNLRARENIRDMLPEIVDRSSQFTEDLLEDQRPRIGTYQTLEDNDDTFSVIVFAIPTNHIFKNDDFQLQVSFVLVGNHLFSAGSKDHSIFPEIMSKSIALKRQFTPTTFFMHVLSELMEMGINVLDQIEEFVDYNERRLLSGGLKRGWLANLLSLKGRLFDANKLIRADIEHIRELSAGIVPELNTEEIGDHVEDRTLYLLDSIDTQRENLSNMINLHLAIASNLMNRQFYWLTIIGSILIIPTIISSIWGMNIDVPQLSFPEMIILMATLMIGATLLVRFLLPKPILN